MNIDKIIEQKIQACVAPLKKQLTDLQKQLEGKQDGYAMKMPEAERILRMSSAKIKHYIRKGRIKASKVGRDWYFDSQEVYHIKENLHLLD